jgi:two-component system phosphate regulon response regulator PhoB
MEPYVLVVDDFPDGLAMVSEYLTARGFAVTSSTNGEEALARAFIRPPLMVLMDLLMPGRIDGLEAIRRLKRDPRTRAATIIAVTARAMAGDDVRSLDAGADGHILKPFDLTALGDTVAAVMARHGVRPHGGVVE